MKCAWQAFINILPLWMREEVDKHGKDTLQELRLRLNIPPKLIRSNGTISLGRPVSVEDLKFCLNVASRYSPWSTSTVMQGYVTAPGGHRIGLCGKGVITAGNISGIQTLTSVCIRIARDFPGIAEKTADISGSMLIIGRPGCGKTTLLRDVIRQWSDKRQLCISVIDEKEEIFPHSNNQMCFSVGKNTDVLSGCKKNQGIEAMLRNMGPDVLAVDEITAQEDCQALLHAGWCGVQLLATAHAGSREDLFARPVYRPIIDSQLFDNLIIMKPDKSWRIERM